MGVNFSSINHRNGVDMGVMEKISEAVKDLPEPLAREVLDFAEYLKSKADSKGVLVSGKDRPQVAKPLASLIGTLSESKLFAGNPVDIQHKLRNEWN